MFARNCARPEYVLAAELLRRIQLTEAVAGATSGVFLDSKPPRRRQLPMAREHEQSQKLEHGESPYLWVISMVMSMDIRMSI